MDPNKYNRTVELLCPTCGGSNFLFDEGPESFVTCTSCGLQLSRDDLRSSNAENVDATVESLKREIASDLKGALRDAFKGNKNFKVK